MEPAEPAEGVTYIKLVPLFGAVEDNGPADASAVADAPRAASIAALVLKQRCWNG